MTERENFKQVVNDSTIKIILFQKKGTLQGVNVLMYRLSGIVALSDRGLRVVHVGKILYRQSYALRVGEPGFNMRRVVQSLNSFST
jgi:hypothetical protein